MEPNLARGEALYRSGSYEDARAALAAAALCGESAADIAYWAGLVDIATGQRPEGLVSLQNAIAINPKYDRALYELGRQAELTKQPKSVALGWYTECLSANPNHAGARAAVTRLTASEKSNMVAPVQSAQAPTPPAEAPPMIVQPDDKALEEHQHIARRIDKAKSFDILAGMTPGALVWERRRLWRSYITAIGPVAATFGAIAVFSFIWPTQALILNVLWAAWPSVVLITIAWVVCDRAVTRYRLYESQLVVESSIFYRRRRALWLYEADQQVPNTTQNWFQAIVNTATLNVESSTFGGRYPMFSMSNMPSKSEQGRLRMIGIGTAHELEQLTGDLAMRILYERRRVYTSFIAN